MISYIALGSNLDNPISQVSTALIELNEITGIEVLKNSSLYKSKAIGPSQPDVINAVAKIKTQLEPEVLLSKLQKLEQKHHRIREQRWGPRTLDLDILLYDDLIYQSASLTIPHPEMKYRSFVLLPLIELEPSLVLPCGAPIADLSYEQLACVAIEEV